MLYKEDFKKGSKIERPYRITPIPTKSYRQGATCFVKPKKKITFGDMISGMDLYRQGRVVELTEDKGMVKMVIRMVRKEPRMTSQEHVKETFNRIMKIVRFKRKNVEKTIRKYLYYNFRIETLRKLERMDKLEVCTSPYKKSGHNIFIKIQKKYYEI